MSEIKIVIYQSILTLFKPLVRILLKYGISYQESAELLKRAFVEVAEKEFPIEGRKQSIARICVLTGLHNKEVKRMKSKFSNTDIEPEFLSRASRVISGWLSDKQFQTQSGKPAQLDFDGEPQSFVSLVKQYSGDMHPRAMLDELLRTGTVEISRSDKIRLVSQGYIPNKSDEQILEILGVCGKDLINTVAHNLNNDLAHSRLQLAVAYDDLSKETVDTFKAMSQKDAHELLNKLNGWLAQHDGKFSNENSSSDRYRAGLGIYYFEEKIEDSTHEN